MLERTWTRIADMVGDEWDPSTRAVACAVATFGIVALLYAAGGFQSLERSTLDARFRSANRPGTIDTSLVLAAIDDKSLSRARSDLKVGWPWPREFYGVLVDYLKKGGARAIVFDVLFPQADFPRANVSARRSDSRFASAMESAGNVALAVQMRSDTLLNPVNARFGLDVGVPSDVQPPVFAGASPPIELFQKGAARLGGVTIEADPDGVVRRMPLAFRLEDQLTLPNLGLAGALAGGSSDAEDLLTSIPTARNGSFLLYWYGPGGVDGAFEDQYVSMSTLIISAARLQIGREPIIPPERFDGKTVIVGGTASGLFDRHATPVSGEGNHPGMEIFATFLSNLNNGHYLRYFGGGWIYGLILLMSGLGAGLVARRSGRIGRAAVLTGALGAVYVAMAVGTFYFFLWWLPVVAPITALVSGFSITSAVSYAVEGRKRRKLRTVFQRYVSPQVVNEVVENPEYTTLGGEEVEGTVFFSDIKGFTSVAEQLSPPEVVQRLNEYFGVATDVVLDHRAMVDKFIGDAIMAVFGAPVRREDHAAQACLAALEMNRALEVHYDGLDRRDGPPFQSRIGIHTGRIVVGNIGTERRVDYTAIGDAVNVAARLEQANKQYGTRVLISETTYEQAVGHIEVREIDLLRVTGKEQPIRIYEVLAPAGALSNAEEQLRERFHEGLEAYRTQHWVRARKAFSEILREAPNDGPANVYQHRVEERAGETLPSSWRGVHEMDVGK